MKRFLVAIVLVLSLSTLLSGCANKKTLFTVGDEKVDKLEALFFFEDMQRRYESEYGENVMYQNYEEGKTVGDVCKEQALETAELINVVQVKAKEQGISLTEEEKTQAKTAAKDAFEKMDPAFIKEYGFTLNKVEDIMTKYYVFNKFRDDYTSKLSIDQAKYEADLETARQTDAMYDAIITYGAEEAGTKVRIRHILIKTVDDAMSPKSQEDQDAALALASDLLEKVKSGEDFVSLVSQYSEDPGSVSNGGEYTFSRLDGFLPEFTNAAFAMEVGEISDLITTDYGFHIIEVLEKDIPATATEISEYNDYKVYVETYVKSQQTSPVFETQYEAWKTELKLKLNQEVWDDTILKGQTGSVQEVTTTAATTVTPTEATTASTEATTK